MFSLISFSADDRIALLAKGEVGISFRSLRPIFSFIKKVSRFYFKTISALFMCFISKSGRFVKFIVSRFCHNFKIFNSVIKFIVIDMVDGFKTLKFSSEKFFHNMTMLSDLIFIDRYHSISVKNSTLSPRIRFPFQITISHICAIVVLTISTRNVYFRTIFDGAFSHNGRLYQI